MTDSDDVKEGKAFAVETPARNDPFFLKGSNALDWGMQNRLARIFSPRDGRTVMLAFDHGYFQGPTTGIERIDLAITPLVPHADVLMCTRGALRTCVPSSTTKPVVLRCSAGQSILTELSNELVAVDIEDAIRLNAAAMAAQVYIGAEYEHTSIANVVKLIDTGTRYGIPTLAVTGVGKDMARGPALLRPGNPDLRRDRRPLRQELLLRARFRKGGCRLPGAHRRRGRQESAGDRGPGDGPQGDRSGSGGRRHGPQHIPVGLSLGDDPSRRRRRPRGRDAEQGLRPLRHLEGRAGRPIAGPPQRRAAAMLPPSTVTTAAVVLAASASSTKAWATSSALTSRPSRFPDM